MQFIKCFDCNEIDELETATPVWNVREPTNVPDYLCDECSEFNFKIQNEDHNNLFGI